MASRLLLVGVLATLGSTATRAETQTLTVRLRNDAAVSADILTDARRVVAQVYRQAQLDLLWLDANAAVTIVLRPVRPPNTPQLPHDAMGYAPGGGDVERGRLAFVLMDRVTAVARGYGGLESIVLGAGIAHELGHLLISKEHSRTGVMKASFNQSDFRKLQDGQLLFSEEESRAIRSAPFVVGKQQTAPAHGPATLDIMVHIVTDARVPAAAIQRAKPIASHIYQPTGIQLTFVDEPAAHGITLRMLYMPMKEASRLSMGVAARGHGRMGGLIYAFYTRIEAYARKHNKPVSQVLGHVMAHELGHLLLPHGSHTKRGIMVAAWDRNQIEQIGRGWLSFSAAEAAQIRARAKCLAALSAC